MVQTSYYITPGIDAQTVMNHVERDKLKYDKITVHYHGYKILECDDRCFVWEKKDDAEIYHSC